MMRWTRASAAMNSDFTPRRCNSARRQASNAIAPPSMRCTADISKSSVCPRDALVSSRRSSLQSGAASANLRMPRRRISPRSVLACTCSIANAGTMVMTSGTGLLRGLCNRRLLKGNLGLCERPAIHGGAGLQGDRSLGEDDSFELRVGAERRLAGNLPEDVLRPRAAAQRHGLRRGHGQIAAGLEDPDVVGAAGDDEVGRNGDRARPFVETRNERLPADVPGAQLEEVRRGT